MLEAIVRIGSENINVNIGPWDEERKDLRFGWDAELAVRTDHWDGGALLVEVGFASIGSLDARKAAERAKSYVVASTLGVHVQDLIDENGYSFDRVADLLSDPYRMPLWDVHIEWVYDPRNNEEDES